jgi:glycosyltransferase involved in cell wall biosynthesis
LAPYPVTRLQPALLVRRQPKLEHPASWIVNLANALAETNEIELHIISASAAVSKHQSVDVDRISYHIIRHAFPCTHRGFPRYLRLDALSRYAFLRWQVNRLIHDIKPEVIHVHGTEYGYGLAALDSGIPTIVSIQGIVNLLAQVSSASSRIQAEIEQQVVRRTKYFGSRTAWGTEFVRSINPAALVYDFPEAIGQVFFDTARASPPEPNILMVGSVHKPKGIEEALEAMAIVRAEFPRARLLVVGTGDPAYLSQLQQRARSLGIEAGLEWLGSRTAAEIARLHATSSLLVHPSYLDNSPNSVAEAMAAGLPVIASNVGGIPSMIDHNETGILVEPRNPRDLALAIISLLRSDSERQRLAHRASAVARERHLPNKVAAQAICIYRDVIAQERDRELAPATPRR